MNSISNIVRLWTLPFRMCLAVLRPGRRSVAPHGPIACAGGYAIEFYLSDRDLTALSNDMQNGVR
jgi:hypothetical protein